MHGFGAPPPKKWTGLFVTDTKGTKKMKMKRRRRFDYDFRERAVKLVLAGQQHTKVARDLGISVGLLSDWKSDYLERADGQALGDINPSDQAAEIAQLRRQLREAEEQRDILKKALSIVGQHGGKATL